MQFLGERRLSFHSHSVPVWLGRKHAFHMSSHATRLTGFNSSANAERSFVCFHTIATAAKQSAEEV